MEVTDELRVLVTAEVDKAVKNLGSLDKSTKTATDSFVLLGKTISAAFVVKEITNFAVKSVAAAESARQTYSVLNATVKATGVAAWTSTSQLESMAESFQDVTNYSKDSIEPMQAVLLGFKSIKGDTFKRATAAVLDMETEMKGGLTSAVQTVGKALDDPVNGLESLRKQGFAFSDAQKVMIKQMVETGNQAGAQAIILKELESTYGGAAEAARGAFTGVKNNLGDIQEGFGNIATEILNSTHLLNGLTKATGWLADGFRDFDKNKAHAFGSDAEIKYYNSLTDVDAKLQEAIYIYNSWAKVQETTSGKRQKQAEQELNYWADEINSLTISGQRSKELQQQENDRLAAESKINDLMNNISVNYGTLAKDDPVEQLKAYQKQLEEIAKNRKTLTTTTTGIDTSGAEKELDYMEKAIRQKMDKIKSDLRADMPVIRWQDFFASETGVDAKLFSTGKEAADQYLAGLEQTVSADRTVAAALGEKFDLTAALENEQNKIKTTLQSLFDIDPSKIDESFKTEDASVQALIARYGELEKAKKQAAGADVVTLVLGDLQKKIDDLGKSEKELTLEQLKVNGATDKQIDKASNLIDRYNAQVESTKSWQDVMTESVDNALNKTDLFDKKTNQVLANLTTNLANVSFDSVLTGFESLGEAFGEGKNASESLSAALGDMAQQILDQLPMLFLQAGLQLIVQGQWPLGLGFIAAAASSSFMSGYVKSKTSSSSDDTDENALGGAYDGSGRVAFAKGSAFTNTVVDQPTFFRFATGNGFGKGLMGEAGPEAVMPLTRGSDGSLGVSVYGAASGLDAETGTEASVGFIINIYNNSSQDVTTSQSTDDNGTKQFDIIIGAVNQGVAGGRLDKSLTGRFGLKVRGV